MGNKGQGLWILVHLKQDYCTERDGREPWEGDAVQQSIGGVKQFRAHLALPSNLYLPCECSFTYLQETGDSGGVEKCRFEEPPLQRGKWKHES